MTLRPALTGLLLSLALAPSAAARVGTAIHLEFDARVPVELARLIEGRIIDDGSLDAWVDLPGNAELLRQGALRGTLDREQLRDNLWHAILGHALKRGTGLGSLAFDPIGDLRKMVAELDGRKDEIERRVQEHVATYLPEGTPEIRAAVRLHLGGTWDGRTRDDIFLNLSFFHDYGPPWFGSVEGIVAHEIVHLAHRQLDVLPEDADTPEGLFAVALAQIHSEGLGRHVEFALVDANSPSGTYAALILRRYKDGLAGLESTFRRVDDLREVCLRRRVMQECRALIRSGLWMGGDTYAIGHGMARAIESALGRKMLASTMREGAARFFELYDQSTHMLPGFPPLGEGFDKDLEEAAAYLAGRRLRWSLAREGSAAHARGEYDAALAAYRRLVDLEPQDAVVAYNLAGAHARKGDADAAIEWLGKAVDLGYRDVLHIEGDPDFDSLRDGKGYRRILERLGAEASDSPKSLRK